jgi:hypothetical protein
MLCMDMGALLLTLVPLFFFSKVLGNGVSFRDAVGGPPPAGAGSAVVLETKRRWVGRRVKEQGAFSALPCRAERLAASQLSRPGCRGEKELGGFAVYGR